MITLAIILEASTWGVIPENCDPADIESQSESVREYLISAGYLIWMENCLKQQEQQEQSDD